MDANPQSPFLFSNIIYSWLESALDIGIEEENFWNMTLAEIVRKVDSFKRQKKLELQERATFDYKLADLIGRSVARIYGSSNRMPDISEVYPTIFDTEELKDKKQEKKNELSVLRFKQFAQSFNERFKQEEAKG